jgi:glucosamine-6-phosphate deaminase
MDEWVVGFAAVGRDHPLSFARANAELCFDRIRPELAMPAENIHFPGTDNAEFDASWDRARCVVMQGGQGEVKHWAFNEPPRRAGAHVAAPPSAAEYRALSTRVVELHPMTLMQNARTSGGGRVDAVPQRAATVGPVQTWQAERVSLWHAGTHDNPFGMRLTALMVSERIVDTAVPVSLLGEHADVTFNYLRSGLGTVQAEMH